MMPVVSFAVAVLNRVRHRAKRAANADAARRDFERANLFRSSCWKEAPA
jgi:hypothetical protein